MAHSIEFKIRYKAAIIYIIVAFIVIAVTVYLNSLSKNISSYRLEIENQRTLLSTTNDLMFSVNNAQSAASLYLSTKNNIYLDDYAASISIIKNLIDSIIKLKPKEENKLHQIESLLYQQNVNIKNLNLQFAKKNPVDVINKRLDAYNPNSTEDTLYVLNTRKDTVIRELPRKGFFQRIGEIFKPHSDSVEMVMNYQIDTIRTPATDSLVNVVGNMAHKARKVYEENIEMIEKQVNKLVVSDKNIASEVSALLLEIHEETLDSTLSIIDKSEKAVKRNYLYSTLGGILALALILIFIRLIINDINKGHRVHLALEAANERTRQIMESRHKLLLSVSHDIKSPLNSILGYLALMKSDSNVRSMQNSSEHILSMLENLLEFSSLEQGMLLKSDSDFNLLDLFKDIYDIFLPLANQKALNLSFSADDIRIHTDRIKLKQIVINLVSNAIKYTGNGTVTFSAAFDKNELTIEIKDTGVGIPNNKLSQLFTPFYRIEENNSMANGTGLGMYVVKGIVKLLGGTIDIHSEVGKGTTILVAIPVERSTKTIPPGIKRIKIYDDDPVTVKIVSDMLLRLGHKVVDTDYDLIITDMEMGNSSGIDILRTAGTAPVVVMTGSFDFSTQKASELGFDGFLAKPFTIDDLREVTGGSDSFDELLGDDRNEIMSLFHASTEENFSILKQALAGNNFKQAQAVCHKMFPMFAQMGYPVEELRKMDAHRNSEYEGWQEDIEKILSIRI